MMSRHCLIIILYTSLDLQVFAFVAPKIIGGKHAPSPVGELGMVEMSQALDLIDVCYEQVSTSFWPFLCEKNLPSC